MKTTRIFLGRYVFGICSLLFGSLLLGGCADDLTENLNNRGNGLDAMVSFHVQSPQDEALNKPAGAMPMTRAAFVSQLSELHLTSADLAPGKIICTGQPNTCLIQTTTAGISDSIAENAHHASTRANITTMATLTQFSTMGFRGESSDNINTPWFDNKETNPDGTLVNPVKWSWNIPWGQFYAVYPLVTGSYSKLRLSPQSQRLPSVDFEVEAAVRNQKDLMTATTDCIQYVTQGVAPSILLSFTHALTAVQFKVGSNLSYNKTITKVEIIGAKSKGRYMLPSNVKGQGSWSNLSDPTTFTLDNLNISTSKNVNTLLTGISGDNYTFYMIPQDLSGVSVKVYFSDNTTINANLKGQWKPGTTVQYGLSEINSKWDYVLTVSSPKVAVPYDNNYTYFGVQSYRYDRDGTQQPVAWKVVGFDANNDDTFSMDEKPAWLTWIKPSSNGSINLEDWKAKLKQDVIDQRRLYNNVMKTTTARGSARDPYDLSTHNYKGKSTSRNTANSYLISAPGYYRIPLVYGNAIKAGADNPSSYKTNNSGQYILSNFKDHLGHNITSPYINVQNSDDPATQASFVWTDNGNQLDNLSVTGSGANSYVNFYVSANNIKNGNTVIAVKNASGTIMWSWHLWFAHDDALDVIPCTNYQGVTYNFTKQTLGFAYEEWEVSSYDKPRMVRVKVEQLIGKNGVRQSGIINITQQPGGLKEFLATMYQFGRKDAMPGTDLFAGNFIKDGGDNMSIQNGIQNPNIYYTHGVSWIADPPKYHCYDNLWSMENTTSGFNDNTVVKTIYDPSPAGFKIPASNAFSGFTITGKNAKNLSEANVSGAWNDGWNFNNKITSPTATIYFPAVGYREGIDGSSLYRKDRLGRAGAYWVAVPNYHSNGCSMDFYSGNVLPQNMSYRSSGVAVRPVSE